MKVNRLEFFIILAVGAMGLGAFSAKLFPGASFIAGAVWYIFIINALIDKDNE